MSPDERFVLDIEIRAARMMINARERELDGKSSADDTSAIDLRAWQMILNVRKRCASQDAKTKVLEQFSASTDSA